MQAARTEPDVVAFEGLRLIARGSLADVVRLVRASAARGNSATILAFDALTSEPVEIDLRHVANALSERASDDESPYRVPDESAGPGGAAAMPAPPSSEPRVRPGRPKLGVIAREVTLLPRHWDWLSEQSGGASAALRRLVETARNASASRDRIRRAQESAYRFMSAMLGNHPHFEEAIRALFAGDRARFTALSASWPDDFRDHARHLADGAFSVL